MQQTWQRIATHFEKKDLKRKKENEDEEEKESLKQRRIEEEKPKEKSEGDSMNEQHPESPKEGSEGDSMDVDGVKLGKFATVLDLNSLNLKEEKVKKEVIESTRSKEFTIIIGNLAVIELNLRREFQRQPSEAKKQMNQLKALINQLMQIQINNKLYFVIEATRKQGEDLKSAENKDKRKVIEFEGGGKNQSNRIDCHPQYHDEYARDEFNVNQSSNQ